MNMWFVTVFPPEFLYAFQAGLEILSFVQMKCLIKLEKYAIFMEV